MQNALWKTKYNFLIFCFTIILFWAVLLIYNDRIIHSGYIGGAIILVFLFFYLLEYLEKRWSSFTVHKFSKKLFITSLLIRLVAAAGLYFFYQYRTGAPFEFYAVDSIFYHSKAQFIAANFSKANFDITALTRDLEFSDKGYTIYLGFIYYLFGPQIFVPRLFAVVFSAITVMAIYRIARELLDEKTGRIAAIMSMLLPNFLLYLGTHLKEPLMLLLLVLALYQSVRIVKLGKNQISNLLLLMVLIFLLFMFRTVLAVVTFSSFLAFALIYKPFTKKIANVLSILFIIFLFVFMMVSSDMGNEIAAYYEKRTGTLSENMQFRAAREGGNKYALMASAPLFLSVILVAPFPSFVYVFEQENLWMFLGANFIRNLYAFFAIAGLIYSIRYKFRERSLLIVFVLGYLGILANSGFAISERFHLPVVPALIILAAAGMEQLRSVRRNYYLMYLLLIAVFIIGWNYIKLAGRA